MEEDLEESSKSSLQAGSNKIREIAKTLPDSSGVYRMVDINGEVLYIGKARMLRKRVLSYCNVNKLPVRLQRMVAATNDMAFVHTNTEIEALLLEANLIKKLKPRYNVLLRDDKSFPYIAITSGHEFPMLTKYRGSRKENHKYFGPFASSGAVNRTINVLQRIFMLRNCSDNVFSLRSRPCLQYQIKRCSAPCVGKVSKEEYASQVQEAEDFLSGESEMIQKRFVEEMKKASNEQNYELAAMYRDRIKAISTIQASQDINISDLGDADVIGLYRKEGKVCIQVFFFRSGQNFGNRSYFPRHDSNIDDTEVITAFIAQFYENKKAPSFIVASHSIEEPELLEEALSTLSGYKVSFIKPERGIKKRLSDFAVKNARKSLERKILQKESDRKLLESVAEIFDMHEPPERIEVYDNSHISGTNMVGAMIAAGEEGFNKNSYRKFNIRTASASDDYGMMKEVIERRFGQIVKSSEEYDTREWPDLLLIDGGKGQLNAVMEVLQDIGIADDIMVVAISKGKDRNAGREVFHITGRSPFQLPENDPALHYLQRLRDEAHRFAIGSHRGRRSKDIIKSPLDDIPGIGAKRKKALLHYFGSGKEVSRAAVQDLQKVEGISRSMAERIYDYFQNI
jgi:excinuclease ABC subunit C